MSVDPDGCLFSWDSPGVYSAAKFVVSWYLRLLRLFYFQHHSFFSPLFF